MGLERIIDPKERERAHAEVGYVDFYSEAVKQSEAFRKEYDGYLNVVKSAQMPLERSPGWAAEAHHQREDEHEGDVPRHLHALHSDGKEER